MNPYNSVALFLHFVTLIYQHGVRLGVCVSCFFEVFISMETDGNNTLLPFFEDSVMRFNLPNILTLYHEVYIGQELFLVQGNKQMKIVEVIEVCESDGEIYLTLEDKCNEGNIIELSSSLYYDSPDYSIT